MWGYMGNGYTNQSRRSNHDIEQSHIGLQWNRWRVYIGTSGGFAIGMTGGIHRNTHTTYSHAKSNLEGLVTESMPSCDDSNSSNIAWSGVGFLHFL